MIVIAGGIGSGKSVIARILRLQGFGVFDCDAEARKLMERDGGLVSEVKKIAGEEIYDGCGRLCRSALAGIIFSDAGKRRAIEKAVHEAVRNRIDSWLKEAENNIFVETAISAVSGIAFRAEEVWMVEASEETRIGRVASRDGRTDEEIRRIMKAQEREEELLADHSIAVKRIHNDSGDEVLAEINRLLSERSEKL